jgi:O-antigen/teichoic acid export membrane protein
MQYLPYVITAVAGLVLYWFFIRQSHRQLAGLFPIVFDWKRFLSLAESSFWVYLYCLASGIYVTTDRLLINAGFGADQIPTYQLNFRLCELALFVIGSASLASLPKITQWLASPAAADQERAVRETDRLNKFQTILGCGAVLTYLAINDAVMKIWLGAEYQAPLLWQAAFAANMAVSAAGYAGFSLAGRCNERGIRFGGIVVAVTGLLKLILSYAAMKMGSILGIALATVISQSFVVLTLSWYTARHLKLSFWDFAIKGWVISLAMVIVSLALRIILPLDSATNLFFIGGISGVALLAAAWVMNVRLADVRHEFAVFRSILGR